MFGDINELPSDKKTTIGKMAEVVTGGTPSRKHPEYYGGNVPWVKTGEIEQGVIYDAEEYITEEAVAKTNCKLLPENTIMLAMYGVGKTRGQSGLLKIKAATNQACAAILPNPNYEPLFLLYYLRTQYEGLRSLGRGAQQTNLNLSMVRDYPVPIVTIECQKAFAEIGLQSDKSKFTGFKSQFIEMFGDPAINSKGLPVAKLPDLGENLDNKRIPITGGNRKAGEYPYYGASGIVDYVADYIFDDDLLLISEDGANLVARVTPIAFPSTGKVWINNHAHVIKFKSMAMQCYVESLLNMMDISPYVTGTAQPKLNQAKLNSIPIPVPEESQIREYLEFVKQSDKSK